jgi:predicted nucleotidyltransferase
MLLDVCLGTRSAWKILLVISEAPGKAVSRKEIRALTGLGNKVIVKFLMLLERFDVVNSKRIGRTHYYNMNMNNPYALQILDLVKLEKKTLNNPDFAVLNILRDFTYELTNINLDNLRKVVLFGSYSKRTANSNSDIDVAIIVSKRAPSDEIEISEMISRLSKRYGKTIQPHYFVEHEKLPEDIRKDGIELL